jgi:hypothetical protein
MILYFKLITGIELVGEVIREDKTHVSVRKPMKFEVREKDGMAFFVLVPFTAGTDIPTFRREHIMMFGEADEAFVNTYKKLTAIKPEEIEVGEDESDLFEDDFVSDEFEDSEPADIQPKKPTIH